MGCGGGFRDLFRMIDSYGYSRRGCGSNRELYYDYNDKEEKIILIKNMYAEGLIGDEEYQNYKNRVYDNNISFDQLVSIKRSKINNKNTKQFEFKSIKPQSKYKDRLNKLKESKEKVIHVKEKLSSSIKDLESEKNKMESLAETMLKSSEEMVEKYINNKIDLEENIQNLGRRRKELEGQVEEIDRAIKELEAKELELEAVKLQEDLSNLTRV